MNQKKHGGGLFPAILMITTVPILVFAFVIVATSSTHVSEAMQREVQDGLKSMESTLLLIYDSLYPGDYELVEEETDAGMGYSILKGDHRLNEDYAVIDSLKEETGLDFTFFYIDTRVITTIRNESGRRIIATGANPVILEDVLYSGKAHFYSNADVLGVSYFAYYAPLTNSDGSCVGMVFVGKPTVQVNESVRNSLIPIFGMAAIGMLITGVFSAAYARRLVSAIRKLERFAGEVEKGNLTAELDQEVLRRDDEMGDMGRSVMNMQKELRTLVEMDALTQMYNRRYGEKKLRQVQKNAKKTGQVFCIALGDIDLFKKVNDTYGHDCGDRVLKNVALLLKKHVAGSGIAARWGGEEFLLVYEKEGRDTAKVKLEAALKELRETQIRYGEEVLSVTMTFGMVEGDMDDYKAMLRDADRLLYQGKENGRNQIVG